VDRTPHDPEAEKRRPDCPECHAWDGLHALSCSHFEAPDRVKRLTDAELAELRVQPPYIWKSYPVTEYDRGRPVVEIVQDHLAALLEEVEAARGGWPVRALAMSEGSARPPLERHQVEAWVNELGKLEVEIPPRVGDFDLDAFLAEHPEHRDRVEAAAKRSSDLLRHAEAVIGEVYSHFFVGSPSSWGLRVSLRALASHLDTVADR
jgi:hypothetical protein